MKVIWSDEELVEIWTLSFDDYKHLENKTAVNKLGFSLTLKYLQFNGEFPDDINKFSPAVVAFVSDELDIPPSKIEEYMFTGRTHERHRREIRSYTGYRPYSKRNENNFITWLTSEIIPHDHDTANLVESTLIWLRSNKLEPMSGDYLDRLLKSANRQFEEQFFESLSNQLSDDSKSNIDLMLRTEDHSIMSNNTFADIKSDPGRVSIKGLLSETAKLEAIDEVNLPTNLLDSVLPKRQELYFTRVSTEEPNELAKRSPSVRYGLIAVYLSMRRRQIIDSLVDLMIQIIHKINAHAERKVIKELLSDLKKVRGKHALLYQLAEAALESPTGVVKDVLYPVVGEQKLRDLVKEFKSSGPAYNQQVHQSLRASYSSHYRRMIPVLLDTLGLQSNNESHKPVLKAIKIIRDERENRQQHYYLSKVPTKEIIKSKWWDLVVEKDSRGRSRINRISYELCVLESLREKIRCKEIWIIGADRYRNPDDVCLLISQLAGMNITISLISQ